MTPVTALKTRWKWNGLKDASAASAATDGGSSAAAIVAQARRTSATWRSGSAARSGRQRLQARKPARSAASGVAKNETFSRFAGREAQLGRQ